MTQTQDMSDIRNAPSVFKDVDLASITDFNSVLDLFNSREIVPESMSDYGTGFSIAKEKGQLVGVPFMIIEWRFNDSDISEGASFVSAAIVTKNGDKLILNDGGTGIHDQLRLVTKVRNDNGHATPQAGLLVREGLTRSDYTFTDAKGKASKATTFYLSES